MENGGGGRTNTTRVGLFHPFSLDTQLNNAYLLAIHLTQIYLTGFSNNEPCILYSEAAEAYALNLLSTFFSFNEIRIPLIFYGPIFFDLNMTHWRCIMRNFST